jgi:hypothetical protein
VRRLAEKLGQPEMRNVRDAEANLANAVHDAQQTLASRADLSLEPDEDVNVFTATVDVIRLGAAALLDLLRADRERTAGQITAGERELFDKTLTCDTRRHLAERIRAANELVDTMNARLERVRTASRVWVRLVWQVDPQLPPGTREARDLLLRNPATLGETEREALHRFFRARRRGPRHGDCGRVGTTAAPGVGLHGVAPVRGEGGPWQGRGLAAGHPATARGSVGVARRPSCSTSRCSPRLPRTTSRHPRRRG